MNAHDPLKHAIAQLSEQCVKCGLCVEHCPTYTVYRQENENPRGRIALMRALADDEITFDEKTTQHLDHCLTCLACENKCPSNVNYHSLITLTRQLQQQTHPKKIHFLISLLRKFPRLAFYAARISRHFGNYFQLRPLKPWKNLQEYYPAVPEKNNLIFLFQDCIDPVFDRETVFAAIKLLNHLGYSVKIPQKVCCGALDYHQGLMENYQAYQQQTLQKFSHYPVVILNPACHQQLRTYLSKTLDLYQFLFEHNIQQLAFKPLKATIALHLPCSTHPTFSSHSVIESLLTLIPELTIQLIPHQYCCGAAGTNSLNHPNMAKTLAKKIIAKLPEHCDYFVTLNIGCQLHLAKFLPKSLKIITPSSLLAQQIITP
ncbi:MAG: (Fe-S)-binding protein [Legionellales bacterium]|nr:(Fe-S)-binding protein [Legionellales bacterium]